MWVISRKKLLEAGEKHADAAPASDTWYRAARKASWTSLAEIRRTWARADQVGTCTVFDIMGTCTVFDIKGNKYWLIVWIDYRSHKVFIKHILTHAEYDREKWKNECN